MAPLCSPFLLTAQLVQEADGDGSPPPSAKCLLPVQAGGGRRPLAASIWPALPSGRAVAKVRSLLKPGWLVGLLGPASAIEQIRAPRPILSAVRTVPVEECDL